MIRSMIFAALIFSAAAARAGNEPPLNLHQPASEVARQIKAIQDGLADGETYSEISTEQRSQVREALGRIQNKLENTQQAGGAVAKRDEAEVFNDQEVVNTILTRAKEDSRMVCRRERPVGSNRPVSQCMTVAERRRLKDRVQSDLTQSQLSYDRRAAGGN